jgi:hypothetical protein
MYLTLPNAPPSPPSAVASNAVAVQIANTNLFGIQIGTYATDTRTYAEVLHCSHGSGLRISYIPTEQITVLGQPDSVAAVAHIPRHARLVRADHVPVE